MRKEEDIVKKIYDENYETFSSEAGKGALKDIKQVFPKNWLYLAELIQNAIDAEAEEILIYNDGRENSLIFQHNGKEFDEKDTKAIASRGLSNKGAGQVGFMGIGFKAVFHCFEKVEISSGNWRFFFEVPVMVQEEYGDKQRDWTGCVLPLIDKSIAAPSRGMSCRFNLKNRIEGLPSPAEDLKIFFHDNFDLFSILGINGVKKIKINEKEFFITQKEEVVISDVKKSIIQVFEPGIDKRTKWVVFCSMYKPSREAIKEFLEHRGITPKPEEKKKIYEDAEKERTVEVICPLDQEGFPAPPKEGKAFALLPTEIKMPFKLFVQGDWLLKIDRQGIMEGYINWHKEMINKTPKLLKAFFSWACSLKFFNENKLKKIYSVFPELPFIGPLDFGEDYSKEVKKLFWDLRFLPEQRKGSIKFVSPKEGYVLPKHLKDLLKIDFFPWELFGKKIINHNQLEGSLNNLKELGLIMELPPEELENRWGNGLGIWFKKMNMDYKVLIELYEKLNLLLKEEDWDEAVLNCILTETNGWKDRKAVNCFPERWKEISESNPPIRSWLEKYLPPFEEMADFNLQIKIENSKNNEAEEFFNKIECREIENLVEDWWDDFPEKIDKKNEKKVIDFTIWAKEKMDGVYYWKSRYGDLILKFLAEINGERLLLPVEECILGKTYLKSTREFFFPKTPKVSSIYFDSSDLGREEWGEFFHYFKDRMVGEFQLDTKIDKSLFKKQSVKEELKRLGCSIEVPDTRVSRKEVTWKGIKIRDRQYVFVDFDFCNELSQFFKEDIGKNDFKNFVQYFDEGEEDLKDVYEKKLVYIPYNTGWVSEINLGVDASWAKTLKNKKWIFCKKGEGPFYPEEVFAKEADSFPGGPIADFPEDLSEILVECGIPFGENVSYCSKKIEIEGSLETASAEQLIIFLGKAKEDDEELNNIKGQIENNQFKIPLPSGFNPIDNLERFPVKRFTKKSRRGEDLGGWLCPITKYQSDKTFSDLIGLISEISRVPENPTAEQMLDFLEWVWFNEPIFEKVQNHIPVALQIIKEDVDYGEEKLLEKWEEGKKKVKVFTLEKEWKSPKLEEIYFNDMRENRVNKILKEKDIFMADPLQLGKTIDEQKKIAKFLELKIVSDRLKKEIVASDEKEAPKNWRKKTSEIFKFISGIIPNERKLKNKYRLLIAREIREIINGFGEILCEQIINAGIEKDRIVVSGSPKDFYRDLCLILTKKFEISDYGEINEIEDIILSMDQPEEATLVIEETGKNSMEETEKEKNEEGSPVWQEKQKESEQNVPLRKYRRGKSMRGKNEIKERLRGHTSKIREARLKKIKEFTAIEVGPTKEGLNERGSRGDAEFREATVKFELDQGRFPVEKDLNHPGYDIESYSHKNGDPKRKLLRRIEVKGRRKKWEDEETVELSERQFKESLKEDGSEFWVYVVEIYDNSITVLPLLNPIKNAGIVELRGGTWRQLAKLD